MKKPRAPRNSLQALENYKQYIKKYGKFRKARNSAIIMESKNVPCAICNNRYPSCVMEFHHRDEKTKTYTISEYVHKVGIEKLLKEIEKCDVLCANCHRILHYNKKIRGDIG